MKIENATIENLAQLANLAIESEKIANYKTFLANLLKLTDALQTTAQ